jgi:hypothetical protein
VISNHFHVIFHVDVERAAKWSEQAVIERWGRYYKAQALLDEKALAACMAKDYLVLESFSSGYLVFLYSGLVFYYYLLVWVVALLHWSVHKSDSI